MINRFEVVFIPCHRPVVVGPVSRTIDLFVPIFGNVVPRTNGCLPALFVTVRCTRS